MIKGKVTGLRSDGQGLLVVSWGSRSRARGLSIIPTAGLRHQAPGLPTVLALASDSFLASDPALVSLLAHGASLCSHQRCLLRVVGFWRMHTDSQAHMLVEGIWAGFSPYKPTRWAPLGSSSVAHIQKPCPSQAPGCCIFYTQLLLNVLVGFYLEQAACQL